MEPRDDLQAERDTEGRAPLQASEVVMAAPRDPVPVLDEAMFLLRQAYPQQGSAPVPNRAERRRAKKRRWG